MKDFSFYLHWWVVASQEGSTPTGGNVSLLQPTTSTEFHYREKPKREPLEIVPTTLAEANAFVSVNHRHHKPVVGHKFSIAISDGEKIRGVVIIGRPVARRLDNGWTLEVNRCCTDGVKNGCSMLYGAAWRAAKALGYKRLITYTLPEEGGASLKASNWRCLGERGGGNWNVKSRPRIDTDALLQGQKLLWEVS